MEHNENRMRGGGFSVGSLLDGREENAQLLFVGAVSCTRHRGFQMGELMRRGRMAVLTPSASDFATGRYLRQIVDAVGELSRERGCKEVVIMYGCQCALLSTDFDLIAQEVRENYGVALHVHSRCHLCRTDEDDYKHGHENGGRHQ